jgi:acetylornithine deacetylase
MDRPLVPRIDGDRLYGRGAYDMKCGVAAMLVAAASAARSGLRGDVLVACVADEEQASLGTAEVARTFRADAAIVTEPTALELVVAHKGFVWAEIETHGRAAHGSRPDLGVDAIVHMGRVLAGLEDLGRELAAGPHHPFLGPASLHASAVQGGEGWSTYPPTCRLAVEWRTLPGEGPADVEAKLRTLLGCLAAADPAFRADLRMDLARSPHEVAEGEPIVTSLAAAARTELGREPKLAGVAYWADCALLADAGIPTVMFGPDGTGAHAAVEWVDLPSVETTARVLERTVRAFCG